MDLHWVSTVCSLAVAIVALVFALTPKGSGPQGPAGAQGAQGAKGDQGNPGQPSFTPSFASFYSSQTQFMGNNLSYVNVSTPTALRYTTVGTSTGDIRCSTTRNNGAGKASGDSAVIFDTEGIYVLNYSLQMDFTDNSNQPYKAEIWLRVNGQDVPDSGSVISVAGKNGETLPFVEYIQSFSPGDTFEIVYWSTESHVAVAAFDTTSLDPSVTVNVPSVITNVYRIG